MRIPRVLGIPLVVGGLIGASLILGPLRRTAVDHMLANRAGSWEKVAARVTDVSLATESDGTMDVKARYVFDWRGASVTGDRVDFLGPSSSPLHRERFEQLQEAHETERPVDGWADPKQPAKHAVLFRGRDEAVASKAFFAIAIFVPSTALVLLGLSILLGRGQSGRRGATFLPAVTVDRRPEGVVLVDHGDTWKGTAGLAFAAIFWNSITWLFVVLMGSLVLKGEMQGAGAVVSMLFMVPFVAVGGGLVYALGKQILVTRQMPAGRLVVSSWPLHPGDPVEAWLHRPLRGATGDEELNLLHGALQLVEEATYTVGTDTRTDKSIAASHDLEPTESSIDREGIHIRYLFEIPEAGPCCFRARWNFVTWRLHLTMQASGYPKDDSQFDLLVVPPGAEVS